MMQVNLLRRKGAGRLACFCLMLGSHAALTGTAPQPAEMVTLEHAPREAVAWHPSVAEAVGRVNEQAQEIRIARSGYYPQVQAGMGANYDNATGSRWRPRPSASISQMLYDFGKVSSAVDVAKAGTKVTRAQLLLSVDALVRDTAYAVIEAQRGMALAAVAQDQLGSVQSISELVRQRYEFGAATRSDALQAEARVEAAQSTIYEISAEQRRWISNLLHLLGRQTEASVSPEAPQWLNEACAPREMDWSAVPAMMQAEAQREEAIAELRRSRANGRPTVSLGAGGATDIHDPFNNRSQYNFGINVSSSVFDGGATRARARGADYALQAANAGAMATRVEVTRLLAEAQQQIGNLRERLDALVRREEQMRETGKLYRLQYLEMGTRTLVDLLNAEQELHQVRFDAANATHDLRRLGIDCLYNSGALRTSFGLSGMSVRGMTL